MSKKIVAKYPYVDNVAGLIKTLQSIVEVTNQEDAELVHVDIAPQVGWQLVEPDDKEYTIHVIEETLSDGSIVHNVEIF